MKIFKRVANVVAEVALETVTFGAYLGTVAFNRSKLECQKKTYNIKSKVTGVKNGVLEYVKRGKLDYGKNTYNIELTAMGVKRGDTQEVIKSRDGNSKAQLVRVPTKEHPYETEIVIDNRCVGYVSDLYGNSTAKLLLEKERRGLEVKVVSWHRVGGVSGAPIVGIRVLFEIEIEEVIS